MSKLGELKEILKKLIAIPSVTGNEHDIALLKQLNAMEGFTDAVRRI